MNITTSLNIAPVVTLGHLLKRQSDLKLKITEGKGHGFAQNLPKSVFHLVRCSPLPDLFQNNSLQNWPTGTKELLHFLFRTLQLPLLFSSDFDAIIFLYCWKCGARQVCRVLELLPHTGRLDESETGSSFASTHPGHVRHIARPLFGFDISDKTEFYGWKKSKGLLNHSGSHSFAILIGSRSVQGSTAGGLLFAADGRCSSRH